MTKLLAEEIKNERKTKSRASATNRFLIEA
jgi:hypothetical protein